MASEWRDGTLGDFIALQRGHDLTEPQRRHGTVPVVGSAGQNGFHDSALAKGPGIVIGRSGASFGRVHFSRQDFWPHNTGLYVTDFKGNDPRFVFYLLTALDFERFNSGSAQPSLNRNFIYPIPIRTPPPNEQRTISSIVGALDDKIELNRRMNATLEAMARALFQSWFIDFDPVRAKLDGRQPPYLDPATAALFPESFQDSELSHIPKHWTIQPLSSLTQYLSRGIGPSYLEQGGVCVLNQKCIRDHRVDFSKSRRHDEAKRPVDDRVLQPNDILVNSTGAGTLGRVAQLFTLPETAIVDSHVTIVRAAAGTDPFFLGINLTGREAEIEALGEGSTGQTELSRIRLGGLNIIAPPFELQRAFGEAVGPLFTQITVNENQSRTLAALRDTLLPKLLSGEIRVGGTYS